MTKKELLRLNCSGFFLVSEIARILRQAIDRGQMFRGSITAGETADGKALDGSFEIVIKVDPLTPTAIKRKR